MGIVSSNPSTPLFFAPGQPIQEAWFAVKKTTAKPARQQARARKKSPGIVQQMALPFQTEGHNLTAIQLVANPQASAANSENLTSGSRLRVVREFDSAISPSCAGRMVISGRIADVCAELERLSHA